MGDWDRKNARRREGPFFIAMALAMTLVVFVGFARNFFLSFWLEPDPLCKEIPCSTGRFFYF